jgi:integrase
MAVRMIKQSWWIDFRFYYTRYRLRSPENSRAGAQAYESSLRQKLARGEAIGRSIHVADQEQTFGQFTPKWFEDYVVPNNKASEQRTKKYILRASLVPFFGKMPIRKITTYNIDQYKAHELKAGITNKTLKNRLTVLNKCLTTAYEWLELESRPPKIKWPKCASYRTDFLSPGECELMLIHSEGVIREMILTALRTGMRQGELKGLQWSSIDWENRMLAVRHSRCDYKKELVPPKNNKERHIPLDTDVFEMLHRRKKTTGYVFLDTDGQPFDNKRLTRRLAKARKSAGLRQFGWHTLRHTFGSQLAAKGAPLAAIKDLMGHANVATTMRYVHLAPSTLRTVIDMLNPKNLLNEDFGQPVVNQWLRTQQKEMAAKTALPKNL